MNLGFGLFKNSYLFRSKKYEVVNEFFNRRVRSEVRKISDQFKFHNRIDLNFIINRPATRFILDTIFRQNSYLLSSKDLAIAISMDARNIVNVYDVNVIMDASNHLVNKLKEIIQLDLNYSRALLAVGKDFKLWTEDFDRKQLLEILDDKKMLFLEYFSRFEDVSFSTYIRVFHSDYEQEWITWDKANSFKIQLDIYNIPAGFVLPHFDYKICGENYLKVASADKGKNLLNDNNGDVVWMR